MRSVEAVDFWLKYKDHTLPCHLCEVLLNGVHQYHEHLGGKRHRRNLRALQRKYPHRFAGLERYPRSYVPGESRGSDSRPPGQQPNRGVSDQSQPAFARTERRRNFVDDMRSFMTDAEQAGLMHRSGQAPDGRRLRTVHIVFEDEADADQNDAQHVYAHADDLWWNTSLGFEPV